MNYPVWLLDFTGGGLLIAMMAVFHVYISHFAIGGGLFLVVTEMKGHREKSQAILDYTKKHTKFFLLLTLVLGALTGVGIWFTISLLNPAATSTLIHLFVFAWATEWVFFVAEIVSILVYYYTFGRMESRKHVLIGWLYFVFAWLSLFVINGIIDFMLTPGKWVVTGNFWDAFFNPTFWPSLFLRTFLALMLAGLYGFITSTAIRDRQFRTRMVRYCAAWLLAPFLFFLVSAYWYATALPPQIAAMIFANSPEFVPYFKVFMAATVVLFLGGLLMVVRLPRPAQMWVAVVLLLIGLSYMGSFEFIREGARRPYIIYGHTFSSSIPVRDLDSVRQNGVLKSAKWAQNREITDANRLQAGKELFNILCLSCHSVRGLMKDILPLTAPYSVQGIAAKIDSMGLSAPYMPPFPGTAEERDALAAYIVNGLHDKPVREERATIPIEKPSEVPPFDSEKDSYILLAWSSMGMHAISDADSWWSLMPPGDDLHAQLIKRGPLPAIVTDGVNLTYSVETGFENPAAAVKFWEYAPTLVNESIERNIGLSGKGLRGTMDVREGAGSFAALAVPVVPYPADGLFMPYPIFVIEARDATTGTVLATTRIVAPVSTEMGCRNCHGGGWRVGNEAGITSQTAEDVLRVHDRINKTNLRAEAEAGRPVSCQACHADPLRNAKGQPGILNLSAAMHGFHANVLKDRGADACYNCHPVDPQGATRSFRGIHNDMGFDCTNCHGTLEDHALSLLLAEEKAGKTQAGALRERLKPRQVSTIDEINPRIPWFNEPDCLTCHVDYGMPVNDSAFNTWTAGKETLFRTRADEMGTVQCVGCHNNPHALYPATNPYGRDRDNIAPMQYQGNPYPMGANKNCRVCHTKDMQDEGHHPNSLRMFRNVR